MIYEIALNINHEPGKSNADVRVFNIHTNDGSTGLTLLMQAYLMQHFEKTTMFYMNGHLQSSRSAKSINGAIKAQLQTIRTITT